MFDEHIPFFEAARIKQDFNALAGAEFAPFVLRINAALAPTDDGPRRVFVLIGE
jgi:hypothetical protein